jgi:hypothetical protein
MIWRKEKRACAENSFFFCDRPLGLVIEFLTENPCRLLCEKGKEMAHTEEKLDSVSLAYRNVGCCILTGTL